LIDRLRKEIQERINQLLSEADRLGRALAALDPRTKPQPNSTPNSTRAKSTPNSTRAKSAPNSTPRRTPKAAGHSAPAASPAEPPAAASQKRAAATDTASSRTRTAPGATKAKVLGALSADGAMTAGEVAKATGLGRPTVSTTLTKLAKSGEVTKAERGYRLPAAQ
jgi:hypothetical protein